MKKLFGFGSSTPPPPPPPAKPPAPPVTKNTPPAKPATPAAPAPAPAPAAAPVAPAAAPAPAPAAPPSIVGRWKEPEGTDTTEFSADGTVTERPASGDTIRGRYSLDGSKLKIKLEGAADELVFPVVIGAETLDMTDPEGQVTRYRRIK